MAPAPPARRGKHERQAEEEAHGIVTVFPEAGADLGVQIIEVGRLDPADLDPRLADLAPGVAGSPAVVLNVDYPLGMAAYYLLREVLEAIDDVRGVYVLGKAATLNGAIGDVLISDVVYDEHSKNLYNFENAFDHRTVAPYVERASVLDNQKAVTVKGTFLQNRDYLEFFYREAYTVVEMEAGPYLSALYEGTYPTRYPTGETVHFRHLSSDFGLIHYASDTPYTRARTLGGRGLSFGGIDATYAASVAIWRRILSLDQMQERPLSDVAVRTASPAKQRPARDGAVPTPAGGHRRLVQASRPGVIGAGRAGDRGGHASRIAAAGRLQEWPRSDRWTWRPIGWIEGQIGPVAERRPLLARR